MQFWWWYKIYTLCTVYTCIKFSLTNHSSCFFAVSSLFTFCCRWFFCCCCYCCWFVSKNSSRNAFQWCWHGQHTHTETIRLTELNKWLLSSIFLLALKYSVFFLLSLICHPNQLFPSFWLPKCSSLKNPDFLPKYIQAQTTRNDNTKKIGCEMKISNLRKMQLLKLFFVCQ